MRVLGCRSIYRIQITSLKQLWHNLLQRLLKLDVYGGIFIDTAKRLPACVTCQLVVYYLIILLFHFLCRYDGCSIRLQFLYYGSFTPVYAATYCIT